MPMTRHGPFGLRKENSSILQLLKPIIGRSCTHCVCLEPQTSNTFWSSRIGMIHVFLPFHELPSVDKWSYGSYLYLYGPYEKYILKASLSTFFEATFSFFCISHPLLWLHSKRHHQSNHILVLLLLSCSRHLEDNNRSCICDKRSFNTHFILWSSLFLPAVRPESKSFLRLWVSIRLQRRNSSLFEWWSSILRSLTRVFHFFFWWCSSGEIDSSTLATKTYQSQVYKTHVALLFLHD